jgi:predicted nucleotidyltransferase
MIQRSAIPSFNDEGNLPPGIYRATLAEIANRFVQPRRMRRQALTNTLVKFITYLLGFGPTEIYIDGSYTTAKLLPSDVDIAIVFPPSYDLGGNGWRFLNKYDLTERMDVHVFKMGIDQDSIERFIKGWTTDLESGRPKGIILLEIDHDQE